MNLTFGKKKYYAVGKDLFIGYNVVRLKGAGIGLFGMEIICVYFVSCSL